MVTKSYYVDEQNSDGQKINSDGQNSAHQHHVFIPIREACSFSMTFLSYYLNIMKEIAWETEVWFANEPEHMIHLNGCKFLEIYK